MSSVGSEMIAPMGSHCFVAKSAVKQCSLKQNFKTDLDCLFVIIYCLTDDSCVGSAIYIRSKSDLSGPTKTLYSVVLHFPSV